mmetsp:Transcript_3111/g.8805  ORF Transcript_3111/g.8805 Transcript_3111/m.8805 type:complete len:321 (+) Transcript_3111:1040-2002(+)
MDSLAPIHVGSQFGGVVAAHGRGHAQEAVAERSRQVACASHPVVLEGVARLAGRCRHMGLPGLAHARDGVRDGCAQRRFGPKHNFRLRPLGHDVPCDPGPCSFASRRLWLFPLRVPHPQLRFEEDRVHHRGEGPGEQVAPVPHRRRDHAIGERVRGSHRRRAAEVDGHMLEVWILDDAPVGVHLLPVVAHRHGFHRGHLSHRRHGSRRRKVPQARVLLLAFGNRRRRPRRLAHHPSGHDGDFRSLLPQRVPRVAQTRRKRTAFRPDGFGHVVPDRRLHLDDCPSVLQIRRPIPLHRLHLLQRLHRTRQPVTSPTSCVFPR